MLQLYAACQAAPWLKWLNPVAAAQFERSAVKHTIPQMAIIIVDALQLDLSAVSDILVSSMAERQVTAIDLNVHSVFWGSIVASRAPNTA